MPLANITQPALINISDDLRLRAYDGNFSIAFSWYQDDVVRKFSEGITEPTIHLGLSWIEKKFSALHHSGELYFIEVCENGTFIAIGDVTLQENNPPIEIGVAQYRGRGIGTRVMKALVNRAKEIGFKKIYNAGCYEDNYASQRMLENAGFILVNHDKEKQRKVFELELI